MYVNKLLFETKIVCEISVILYFILSRDHENRKLHGDLSKLLHYTIVKDLLLLSSYYHGGFRSLELVNRVTNLKTHLIYELITPPYFASIICCLHGIASELNKY